MASAKYFVQPEFKNKRRFLEPKIVMMKKYREIDDFENKFTEICSVHHSDHVSVEIAVILFWQKFRESNILPKKSLNN